MGRAFRILVLGFFAFLVGGLLSHKPTPPPVPPPVSSPSARPSPKRPASRSEEQELLKQMQAAESGILAGLESGNRERLQEAYAQTRQLYQSVEGSGPFYLLKYHTAWLERELAVPNPVAPLAKFDRLEKSGFRYFYDRGAAEAADMIRRVQRSREERIAYEREGDPSLELEAARQLATGQYAAHRMHRRCDRLLSHLDLRGQAVVDYATGTGMTLPALLKAVGPEGTVHAVDVAPSVLAFIKDRGETEPALADLRRVHLVRSSFTDSGLPGASVDWVFLDAHPIRPRSSGVYGDCVRPLVRNILRILKPGGRLLVWSRQVSEEELNAIMADCGFLKSTPVPMGYAYENEEALVYLRPGP